MIDSDVSRRYAGEAERGQGVAAFPAATRPVSRDGDPHRLLGVVPRRGQVPSRWDSDTAVIAGKCARNRKGRELADGAGNDVGQRGRRQEALPLV